MRIRPLVPPVKVGLTVIRCGYVRWRGDQIVSAPVELVGNALCLDFTNTVNRRPHPERDWLESTESWHTWLRAVGLDSDAFPPTPVTLLNLRELREAVYALFASIVHGGLLPQPSVAIAVDPYAAALPRAVWRRAGVHLVAEWSQPQPAELVSASAVQLLSTGPLDRIGQCPGCGWLFLDTTRNGSRRWCSMATCGSRVKSARYFDRSRRGAED